MVRNTSIEAYRLIKNSGALSKMRWLVYDTLFHNGPLTRNELDALLKHTDEINPSYHKRLSELVKMNVVSKVGTKTCSITKFRCYAWDVTTQFPTQLPKVKTLSKPTKQKLAIELEKFSRILVLQGYEPSSEFFDLIEWLEKE